MAQNMNTPDVLTDEEMNRFESSSNSKTVAPDVMDDAQMAAYEKQPGNIPKTESFLDRAMKIPAQVGYEVMGGTAPSDIGMGLASKVTGNPFSHGLNIAAQAEGMRKKAVGDNTLLDIGSDPMTYVGAGEAAKGVASGAKGAYKVGRSLFKPSEVYGEALGKAKGSVNFLDIVNKHIDDPLVKKVLDKSGVIEKFGGTSFGEGGATTEKLANLSPRDSQAFINEVKVGQNKAFLSGDATKSNQIGLAKFFKDLSQSQSEALGLKGAKRLYGFSKNVGRFGKAAAKRFVSGTEMGAGAKTAWDLLH